MTENSTPSSLDHYREQARTLHKLKLFEEALPLHQVVCQSSEATGWDHYYMANTLHKLRRYDEAREACKRAWKMFPDAKPDDLRRLAGWCVYQCGLKPLARDGSEEGEDGDADHQEDGPSDRLEKAAKAAEWICRNTSQSVGSPFTKAVLTFSKILKRAARWQQLEEWTARLDPSTLSPDPWIPGRSDQDGKTRELASDLETWFGYRTKALLQTERYAECADLCEQYERAILKPHYDWDVWIPFYRAQSLRALGRRREAHSILDGLLRKKRAASLLRFKASLLQEDGDLKRAWQVALDGALELRETKNDPKLVQLLARLARERGDLEAARRHFELYLATYRSQDWNIPEAIRIEAENAGVTLLKAVSVAEADHLFRELRRWWWKELESIEPRVRGVVENIIGQAGFIRTGDRESLYFNAREFKRAALGMEVDFWIREGWDYKKKCISKVAVRVRVPRPTISLDTDLR